MSSTQNKIIKTLLWIVAAMFLLRLVSLGFSPMLDTTEARYSEIGRIMFETGNWLTPMFDYGVPFWGKPPLSFWATAASFHLFGVNDFAARFPHLLFMLGTAVLIYFFVRRWRGKTEAAIATAVLATLPVFLWLAGGVMTDPALTLVATLSMISFYNAIQTKNKWQGYLFFIGLGLGLLAKGPLVFVIVGMPIFFFVLLKNKWKEMWQALPWVGGILLMLAISAPWYYLAERATPGFLYYFIVGEHFLRYVVPGWTGDMYGTAHGGFPGKIWIYWLVSLAPWIAWIAIKMFKKSFRKILFSREFLRDDFLLFMILNIVATLMFFSFAGNVIQTYVITTLAPSAILIGYLVGRNGSSAVLFKWFAWLSVVLFSGFIGLSAIYPKWSAAIGRSDRSLAHEFLAQATDANSPLFYYGRGRTWSSRFYSNGRAIQAKDASEISAAVKKQGIAFVLISRGNEDLKKLAPKIIDVGKKVELVKISKN